MHTGKYVFAQLIEFLPQKFFQRIILEYQGDKYVKSFSCWSHLLVMVFGLSWSSSTGQLFDKVKLMMLFKPGLAGKVILKFSGDPSKEVSRINFGNNFDSVPKDKVCLCC